MTNNNQWTKHDGPTQYKKKPVVIEAIQWTGDNTYQVTTFINSKAPDLSSDKAKESWFEYCTKVYSDGLTIYTLEDGNDNRAKHVASIGDWIIKGVKGEFYPCKPDIFEMTYEIATY